MIRDILLGLYGGTWSAIALLITWRTGEWPPPAMWGILGFGLSGILTVFRVDKQFMSRNRNTVDDRNSEAP